MGDKKKAKTPHPAEIPQAAPPLPPPTFGEPLFNQADLKKRGDAAGIEVLEKLAASGNANAQKKLKEIRTKKVKELLGAAETASPSGIKLTGIELAEVMGETLPDDFIPLQPGTARLIVSSDGSLIAQGFIDFLQVIGFIEVQCEPERLKNICKESMRQMGNAQQNQHKGVRK
jgi:hypothetical protein